MKRLLLGFLVILIYVSTASAREAICDSAIKCIDFDSASACPNSSDKQCFRNHGLTDIGFRNFQVVKNDNKAAVGNGYITGTGEYGSTGAGYSKISVPSDVGKTLYLRYYVKFSDGYMSYTTDHGPGLNLVGDNDCRVGGTFEQSPFNYKFYLRASSGCGFPIRDEGINVGLPKYINNNRWYLVELQYTIDTQCSNPNAEYGCNGILRAWIDGQLGIQKTNMNLGGVKRNTRFTTGWGPRNYYHVRSPKWGGRVSFDNFVLSKTRVGPATNENPRGTPDMQSPYANHQGVSPFFGRHPAKDCTRHGGSWSKLGQTNGKTWRNNLGTLDTNVYYPNGFEDKCSQADLDRLSLGQYNQEASMKVVASRGNGGGVAWDRWSHFYPFNGKTIYGFMKIDNSSSLTGPTYLSGFTAYGAHVYSHFVSIVIKDGKYGIAQRKRDGSTQYRMSNKSAVKNRWTEFEIFLGIDNKIILMIDRQRVVNTTLPSPHPEIFYTSSGAAYNVLGVIDNQGPGTFIANFDETSVGTASYWSCDGWGASSCPFNSDGSLKYRTVGSPGTPPVNDDPPVEEPDPEIPGDFAAPSNFRLASTEPRKITASWNASNRAGLRWYKVKIYNPDGSYKDTEIVTPSEALTHTFNWLQQGATYRLTVEAETVYSETSEIASLTQVVMSEPATEEPEPDSNLPTSTGIYDNPQAAYATLNYNQATFCSNWNTQYIAQEAVNKLKLKNMSDRDGTIHIGLFNANKTRVDYFSIYFKKNSKFNDVIDTHIPRNGYGYLCLYGNQVTVVGLMKMGVFGNTGWINKVGFSRPNLTNLNSPMHKR